MSAPDKVWPVLPPIRTVCAPSDCTDYDMIEIGVRIRRLRAKDEWDEWNTALPDLRYDYQVVRLDAKDQQAMLYILRQLLEQTMRVWWGGEA